MVVWVEDYILTEKILEDIGKELELGQERYLAKLPHQSELIYCLTRSFYNRVSPLPPTRSEVMLFSVGLGLEAVLLRPHRKPEAGETDGIHWSADWLEYEGAPPGEFKSTRISMNRPPGELPETWRKQVLGYMKGINQREVSLAVLHLMGNYRPPFPDLKVWRGRASLEEIKANWDWLKGRRDVYLDHLERGEPPQQFAYNEEWECENCRYLIICQAKQSIENLKKERGINGNTK